MIDLRRTLAQPHLLRRIAHHDKRPNADFQVPSWTSPKRGPADTLPSEQSFLTAIGIAQQQKARNFELRAAPSVAIFITPWDGSAMLMRPSCPQSRASRRRPTCRKWAAHTLPTMLAETDEVNGIIAEAGYRGTQTADGWCDQWP